MDIFGRTATGQEVSLECSKIVFALEAVGRESAPDVVLHRQVLPAVIQMTAPPHRQWARTNTYPGEAGTHGGRHIEFP